MRDRLVLGALAISVIVGVSVSTQSRIVLKPSSVLDYGAVCDGVADDTVPMQVALTAVGLTGGVVRLPAGRCKITSGLTIAKNGVSIIGEGRYASTIIFANKVAGQAAITVDGVGTATVYHGAFRSFGLGPQSTLRKVGIRLVNVSSVYIDDVGIFDWQEATSTSVGIELQGRELIGVTNSVVTANRPLVIANNPDAASYGGLDADTLTMKNLGLDAVNAVNPVVTISDGVYLSNTTFDTLNLIRGSHGIYWADTTSTLTSDANRFLNLRWEQATASAGWLLYVSRTTSIAQALQIDTCDAFNSVSTNGIFLRNVDGADIARCVFRYSGKTAIDVDATNRNVVVARSNVVIDGLVINQSRQW